MNKSYTILYLGDNKPQSNSYFRIKALERMGHSVLVYNPAADIQNSLKSRWWSKIHYNTGYLLLQNKLKNILKKVVFNTAVSPDLIWVNSGELLGPACMKILKKLKVPIVLYNNDDPTGGRDGNRFLSLLKALPYYDLCAVLRVQNVEEYKQKGAPKVIRVLMSYDEIIHKPFASASDIRDEMKSEVAFIGTWMKHENRDSFILELTKRGVPVSIRGDHWNKSPYFEALKPYWKGPAVYGREYVEAIQGAKICLGFLSKGNRDLHTRRSVEVPYIGSLFCAERTSEHMEMYKEGAEAVFWSSAQECADQCLALLADESRREAIRVSGMQRVLQLHAGNEDIGRQVLTELFGQQSLNVLK